MGAAGDRGCCRHPGGAVEQVRMVPGCGPCRLDADQGVFRFGMAGDLFFLYGDHTQCMEFPCGVLPGHPGVVERAVAVRG